MLQLLKKELTLTASPLTYCFLSFSAMTMIPGYPILVGTFFVCLGVFYTFQSARESNDILFTVLLPVAKREVVKAKFAFTVCIQLISVLLVSLLTVLRMTLLSNISVYTDNPMMNANVAYLLFVFIIHALFILFFLIGFFKTSYYIAKPFIHYCIGAFGVVMVGETRHHFPGLNSLNAQSGLEIGLQWIVLALGIVVYGMILYFSYHKSVRQFEKLDLTF